MLEKKIILPSINVSLVEKEIGDFIVKKILELNCTGGVVGLSGGVDSTLTALLAKKAFDGYNKIAEKKLELVGYIIPSHINNPSDTEDGRKIAEKLEIRREVVDLGPALEAFKTTNPETFPSQYQKGNMISRIRAVVLNTKAMYENKLVLGTGNFDEDFGVGYYTLFGDGAVHISPIGRLHKRLVKQIVCENGFFDIADKEPTAGLELNQSDFGDLGYSYETVEVVIEGILQGIGWDELKTHTQVKEMTAKDNEKYENMFGRVKFATADEVVDDINRRNVIAKRKSSLISPAIPEITLTF
jgi:NAD+ synthase